MSHPETGQSKAEIGKVLGLPGRRGQRKEDFTHIQPPVLLLHQHLQVLRDKDAEALREKTASLKVKDLGTPDGSRVDPELSCRGNNRKWVLTYSCKCL